MTSSTIHPSTAERERVIEILNRVFARRYHSLARYVANAVGFVAEEDRPLLRRIEEIAAWDAEQAEDLSQAIEGLDGIPQVDVIDPDFAELNYLSIHHLSGVLRQSLEQETRTCREYLSETRWCLSAHRALRQVCEGLERHAALLSPEG
jgi:bacterioferritin (cytochrome b1)